MTTPSDETEPRAIEPEPGRRRMSIEEMLAVGDEIAAMPLLDARSPQEIMDDLNSKAEDRPQGG
jgi:hypothetical protein